MTEHSRRSAKRRTGWPNLLPPLADVESGDLVRLSHGFQVRRRFVATLLVGGEHGPRGRVDAAVAMVDGVPMLTALVIQTSEPVDTEAMAGLVGTDLLDAAVRAEALRSTPAPAAVRGAWQDIEGSWADQTGSWADLAAEHGTRRGQWKAAAQDAAGAARRRRVTPSLLADVLAIHDADGIQGVMTKLNYSERNARRLLARARKELT